MYAKEQTNSLHLTLQLLIDEHYRWENSKGLFPCGNLEWATNEKSQPSLEAGRLSRERVLAAPATNGLLRLGPL